MLNKSKDDNWNNMANVHMPFYVLSSEDNILLFQTLQSRKVCSQQNQNSNNSNNHNVFLVEINIYLLTYLLIYWLKVKTKLPAL